MSSLTKRYTLEIASGIKAPVTVHISQGDSGQAISFDIENNGVKYEFFDETVTVYGTRVDGAVFGPYACTFYGNTVSFAIQPDMSAFAGPCVAEISITSSSGVKVGSANFAILVEQSAFPNGISYSTDRSVYEAILKYVQNASSVDLSNAMNNAVKVSNNYSKDLNNTLSSSVDQKINNLSSTLNERISNLVVAAGGSNITEVVDARAPFSGSSKSSLHDRLDLFLEYDVVTTIADI